jgi:phage shock protein A
MERPELEIVKEKIAKVEAELIEAKSVGDREMVLALNNNLTALNNNLTELRKKENLLLAQASAGMSRLMVSLLF